MNSIDDMLLLVPLPGPMMMIEFIDIYQWVTARLQYLQCINDGDTAVLH